MNRRIAIGILYAITHCIEVITVMLNYLLVCRSITYAQRTARALDHAGITAIVMRTPKALTPDGCSYCVKIPERYMTEALITIKNAGLPSVRVYTQSVDGTFGEEQTRI